MKFKDVENKRAYDNVIAYKDSAGDLILHPKYFNGSYLTPSGKYLTGYVEDGVIYAPVSGDAELDDFGVHWNPERYPLTDCYFAGDTLSFTFD